MYMHTYKYIICIFTHTCIYTLAAQTKVEFELCLGLSAVDYICILGLLWLSIININYGLLSLIDRL